MKCITHSTHHYPGTLSTLLSYVLMKCITGGSAAAATPAHVLDRLKGKFSWVREIVEALLFMTAAQTLWRTAKVTGSNLISPMKTWTQIRCGPGWIAVQRNVHVVPGLRNCHFGYLPADMIHIHGTLDFHFTSFICCLHVCTGVLIGNNMKLML